MLLHDPADAEPFWNRLVAPTFPGAAGPFDRDLAEAIVAFGLLARYPHIRPVAAANHPPDLTARLLQAGFDVVGEDRAMVLRDPDPSVALSSGPTADGVVVERLAWDSGDVTQRAAEIAVALVEAFEVGAERRAGIERDALASLLEPGVSFILVRVHGELATVAKRTSRWDATYLSSIGTRSAFRGRGLGRLAAASAVADALRDGADRVHLVVEADNRPAIKMYERLGFDIVGDPVPDLLLRG